MSAAAEVELRRALANLEQLRAFRPRNPAEAQTHAIAIDNCERFLADAGVRSRSFGRHSGHGA